MIPMYRAPYRTEHQPMARLNVHWDNNLGMITYIGVPGPHINQPMCRSMIDVIGLAAKRGGLWDELEAKQ